MAFSLTTKARLLLNQVKVGPQIILEIDGFDQIFGAIEVTKIVEIGDEITIGDDFIIGGVVADPNGLDYISLDGTTNNISSQIERDKGSSSSVSSMKITMLDKNNTLTNIFSPGVTVPDPLAVKARVYLNFEGGAHPEDSINIFNGIIDNISFGSGTCVLNIAHPDQLKRQEIFIPHTSELNGAIDNSVTTITLLDTSNLLTEQDALTTYVQIEDEIIRFTGISGNDLTGCTRGALGTTAASHDDATEVVSFYRLQGDAMELALKIMTSDGGNNFAENVGLDNFVDITPDLTINNAIHFNGVDVAARYGLTVGDYVSVSGANEAANNFTDRTITAIDTTDTGSYIIVSGAALAAETDSPGVAAFKSQYNTLPDGAGLGMSHEQIDIDEHLRIQTLFSSAFHNYDFYIRDQVNGKEFIEQQIFFPSGMFTLPRKGKVSVGYNAPPIVIDELITIGLSDVVSPEKLEISRGVNKNFYNYIVFKFEEYALEEDRFLAGIVTTDADSTSRIQIGTRPLTIESKGIRANPSPASIISIQSRRLLNRYKYGAEQIKLQVLYKKGFNIEVGDSVIFEGVDLKIADTKNASRSFEPRIMEVVNKSMNIKNGRIELTLMDTNYSLDAARYGVISPSSVLGSGSTTTELKTVSSYGNSGLEINKWEEYFGKTILVHDQNWTFSEETTLVDFDSTDRTIMNVSPALSTPPSAGYIVELANYGSVSGFPKSTHCWLTDSLSVVSGVSSTQFTLSSGDAAKLSIGDTVRIHNESFSNDSGDVEITNIVTTTITVEDMGFTPSAGDVVDLVRFTDGGDPYRIL